MIIRNLIPFSILMDEEGKKNIEQTIVGIGLANYCHSKLIKSYITDSKMFINKINEIGLNHSVELQVYNPTFLILPEHLYYAVNYATHAFYYKKNFSKSALVEYLLYASGQKQIQIALDIIGFNHNEQNQLFAYTIVGKDLDTIKKVNADLKIIFDIDEIELDTIQYSMEQLSVIQKQMEISNFQLQNTLNIMVIPQGDSNHDIPVQYIKDALLYCIKEKMAYLSIL